MRKRSNIFLFPYQSSFGPTLFSFSFWFRCLFCPTLNFPYVYFWAFYSDPLVYKSFPEPIPHCFNLENVKRFANSNRISYALNILSKYFLAILGCLLFHINFIINLASSRKKKTKTWGNFYWDCIKVIKPI